ncbi:MAG: hypothetical protein NTY38_16270 [Acidobacteria bacterium]|nr:hypothetical protein [Acidobacteriota bacterium]
MFGALSDLAGWRERQVEADSVSALRDRLTAEDAGLGAALLGPGAPVADLANPRPVARLPLSVPARPRQLCPRPSQFRPPASR